MGDLLEILLTTDISSSQSSATLWDYNSGTHLHSYRKAGIIKSNSIGFIRNEYIIAADKDKPLLHIWPVNSQEVLKNTKTVCSGKVSALSVSSDGNWCAAGIGEQLYVWNITSGLLITIVAKHFQPITKVLFTADGSYVITAGEDGLILVWSLGTILSQSDQNEPLHILSDHTLPIVDLYISQTTSATTRIYSVSLDCTMKIHELISGRLLLSVVFDKQPTSIAVDAIEKLIFVGHVHGVINEINLLNPPRNIIYHHKSTELSQFKGHEKAITSLSVSADGMSLASGSEDSTIVLWHILSKQKLRTITVNGPVSNVLFISAHTNFFVHDLKPTFTFTPFQRTITVLNNNNPSIELVHSATKELPFNEIVYEPVRNISSDDQEMKMKCLQDELAKLKCINKTLYEFGLDCVLEKSNDVDQSLENGIGNKTKKKRKEHN